MLRQEFNDLLREKVCCCSSVFRKLSSLQHRGRWIEIATEIVTLALCHQALPSSLVDDAEEESNICISGDEEGDVIDPTTVTTLSAEVSVLCICSTAAFCPVDADWFQLPDPGLQLACKDWKH